MKKTYSYLSLLLGCWTHQVLHTQARVSPAQNTSRKKNIASQKKQARKKTTPNMNHKIPILIIICTNRPNSLTETTAHRYKKILEATGATVNLLTLRDLPADFTQSALYDNRGKNPAFNKMAAMVESHQKYVFVLPEYNGSMPGVLKAFIDGLPNFNQIFKHKKAAFVAVSRGRQGGLLALSHLTDILIYLGMHIYSHQLRCPYITGTTLKDLEEHPRYLDQMKRQAEGFVNF